MAKIICSMSLLLTVYNHALFLSYWFLWLLDHSGTLSPLHSDVAVVEENCIYHLTVIPPRIESEPRDLKMLFVQLYYEAGVHGPQRIMIFRSCLVVLTGCFIWSMKTVLLLWLAATVD